MGVTVINLDLRGQSNAMYFAADGGLDRVKSMAEAYLGFDGVANRINLVADVSPWNSAFRMLTSSVRLAASGPLDMGAFRTLRLYSQESTFKWYRYPEVTEDGPRWNPYSANSRRGSCSAASRASGRCSCSAC
jgi:hypothetical protein